MERYNPQSIEKQARKWPVFAYETDIYADLRRRVESISGFQTFEWFFPVCEDKYFDNEIIKEYGIDACRLSVLDACGSLNPGKDEYLRRLDSSYNLLSRFYDSFQTESDNDFDEKPWLRAILQAHDHVVTRCKPHLAFALVCKAFKVCRPGLNLRAREQELILSAVYPFMPILAVFLANNRKIRIRCLKEIFEESDKHVGVRFKIGNGGWHREVFDKLNFARDPISELTAVKWVNVAAGDRRIKLIDVEGGKQIVFFN